MKRYLALFSMAASLTLPALALGQPPEPDQPRKEQEVRPVRIVLPDQYEREQDTARYRGDVLVVLYGDRQGMPANKELGEKLQVQFHPDAAGQSPGRAALAPPTPLQGLPAGQEPPDVRIIPVAAIGKVPGVVENIVRNQVKKASPEVPVWLDFGDTMARTFGMRPGQPNLVVLDGWGRLRFRVAGEIDAPTYARLVEVIDYLRKETAGLVQPPQK